MAPQPSTGSDSRSADDRLGRLFLVRENERGRLLHFIALFWVVGTGLAIGQGAAHALFLKRFGIEHLPEVYVVLGIVLAATGFAYAAIVDRFPSERLLRGGFLIIAGLAAASSWLMHMNHTQLLFAAFFLLYEVSSEWLLAHCGWYLSQNLDVTELKRLSPLVFAGWQFGILCGGLILTVVVPVAGAVNVIFLWSLLLVAGVFLVHAYHRRRGVSPLFKPQRGRTRGSGNGPLARIGLRAVLSSKFLRPSLFALFFLVLSVYTLTYSVSRVYTGAFDDSASLGAFLGRLLVLTGGLAMLLQLFVAGRLIRRIGVVGTNLVFPLAGLTSFGLLFASFSVPSAIVASVVKDAIGPAIHRPTRLLMLSAVPIELRGRARAATLVCIPAALCVAGTLLGVAQRIEPQAAVIGLGIIAVLALIYFTWRSNAIYPSTLLASLKEQVFVPPAPGDAVQAHAGEAQHLPGATGDEARNPRPATFTKVFALRHAADALRGSADSGPALQLLQHVIEERWTHSVDQCLTQIEDTESAEVIETVRAALRSREPQHIAIAAEALHNLRDTRYAGELARLLDRFTGRSRKTPSDGPRLDDAADVAAWCMASDDPWLRECGACTEASLQDPDAGMPELLRRILLLKRSPVFREVDTEELRVVAQELVPVAFAAGTRVFDIHQPSDRFFLIERGRIGVSTDPKPTVERFVTILGPGSSLGEIGCFDNLPRSATAHVVEDSDLLALEKSKLYGLVLRYPNLSLGLLRGIGSRLRDATKAET